MSQMDQKGRLFYPSIEGQESWAALFQSIEAFSPLLDEIYSRNHLEIGKVYNLTPGTNAVFRISDTVVKVFAPNESGFSTGDDYFIELAALKHANKAGVAAPLLVCSGNIEDRYLFRYIVMKYVDGQEAEHCLAAYTKMQKHDFASRLKIITEGLNVKYGQAEIPTLNMSDYLDNKRWNALPGSFREDRKAYLRGIQFPEPVYTHGDLTGENVIIGQDGSIYVIDFADSRIAPYYYEWPPIVFGLFGCEPTMMEAYFGSFHNGEFYDQLTLSVLIHEFGAPILRQICNFADVPIENITDISILRKLLRKNVESGQMKVR